MADGGLTIELDPALSARLRDAAQAAGETADEFAARLIAHGLEDDWTEAIARYAEYQRTGEYIDAESAMREFRENLRRRLDEKRK